MTADFTMNPQANWQEWALGEDRQPLLVIDGLLQDPQSLVTLAAEGTIYGPAGASYPGLRGALPTEFNRNMYAAVAPLLQGVFEVSPERPLRVDSTFAMVTRPADNLRHTQRIPHIDRADPRHLAMVLYLCDESFGGTSFFRHKSTGFQTITPEREGPYSEIQNREMNAAPIPSRFPGDDHPFYDRVFTVPARFNRLVVYRSQILHSPAIEPHAKFSEDPRKGRLTITSFLWPEETEGGVPA